jgi:Domain of Unknown Function (DUF928)
MKTSIATILLGAATAVALSASTIYAAEPDARKPTTAAAAPFAYQPPMRGAPATRVGGGTRTAGEALTLNVLAPNETGYTTHEKPTIYWFVSQAVNTPVAMELTLISNESLQAASKPLLEITLQPPLAKGIHALRLADHGITLSPGVEYQWFVAVVRNPAQRSNDTIAGGTIKRVADSDAVQSRLKQTLQAQWPAVYAEAGIWYDAIDQLSQQISKDASNRQLREQRAALLEQVGLRTAADFDRGAGI